MKLRSFLPIVLLLGATSLSPAADPAWWATRGVVNASPASNLSPATIGQAKHMAAMALAELQTQLSLADYSALQSQVASIVNFSTPQTPAEFDNQRMVLLTGQLKALAKPFYDKLRTLDAAWLDNEMVSSNIRVVEPGSNPIAYSPYPWSVATSDDQNKAVATLGQLKAVFSLRFEIIDTDHDGLPDAWERLYFPNLDQTPDGDADGDGLSNARERDLGWNPSVSDASVDTDGDGMSDAWEFCYFPNLDQTPGGDPDGDGLTNAMEFSILSNPNNPDTDGDGMGDGYEEYYELSVNSPENIPAPGPEPVPGPGPDNDQDDDGKTNRDEWDGGSIPISPGEQPKFTYPPATLKWFGVAGKVYFVQWTTDFNTWNTLPSEQLGTNHEITFLPATGFFFRLKIYLDANEDTDADGLPDWREIEKLGTDPDKMDSDGDGLNDDEEVQRGTDPNNPNSDGDEPSNGDELSDGEDADPRDNAINWKITSEPGYAFLEIEGWDQTEHGEPIMTNNGGQVLCQFAVWGAGDWTKLSGAWSGINSPPVIISNTYKNKPEDDLQSIELYSAQATSIDDNGSIAGYASGVSWRSYQGSLPLSWDSAGDASPVALGVPDVIINDPSNYHEDDVAHVNRDGIFTLIPSGYIVAETPIHTMRRYLASLPLVSTAASPSNLRCYGNSTVGRFSRDGACTGITYGDNQPWVWRGSGEHEIISGSNTDVPLYYPNITQTPINLSGEIGCMGTTPPAGAIENAQERPAIILGGSVLIHNGTKWVKSKSLQGATALSKSGTALTYQGADSAVWRNAKVAKIKDLCPSLEDRNITGFTPIDINDQGVILIKYQAPPPASIGIFHIGILLPVEIEGPEKKVLTKLKVGKVVEAGVLSGAGESTILDIGEDSDRFYVRVRGAASIGAASIKVATVENPTAQYNDDETEIDLQVQESDLITKSMLLVSDDIDDGHKVDSIADDLRNDRTHRIQLGGKFCIRSITLGNQTIPLNVNAQASCRKRLSGRIVLVGSAADNALEVAQLRDVAVERYAQAGVKLELYITTMEIPSDVNEDDVHHDDGGTSTPDDKGNYVHPDMIKIIDKSDSEGKRGKITIFVVPNMTGVSLGRAYTKRYTAASYQEYALCALVSAADVLSGQNVMKFTLAHEIGHLLTNEGHYPYDTSNVSVESISHNLMREGTSPTDTLGASKRFLQSQEDMFLEELLSKP